MILAALLLAALCTPDATFTPTPTLRWVDPAAPDLAGHVLFVCPDSGACGPVAVLPCWWYVSEDTGQSTRYCPGTDLDVAVQRFVSVPANTTQRFEVAAYDLSGNLSLLSSSVTVCMSPVCVKPGPCQ